MIYILCTHVSYNSFRSDLFITWNRINDYSHYYYHEKLLDLKRKTFRIIRSNLILLITIIIPLNRYSINVFRDIEQWLKRGALSMSLPAVRFRMPLGAEFSEKYHGSHLSILGHCFYAVSSGKALNHQMLDLTQVKMSIPRGVEMTYKLIGPVTKG